MPLTFFIGPAFAAFVVWLLSEDDDRMATVVEVSLLLASAIALVAALALV